MVIEKNWASDMALAKQLTARHIRVPLALQKKQLLEEITYFKNLLITVAKNKNRELAEKYFRMLVELRIRLLGLTLQNFAEVHGTIDRQTLRRYSEQYHRECLLLARAADTILGTT